MNDFSKLNLIRENASRKTGSINNLSVVDSENGFKHLRILWLYPDVMHLHGGRGDVMGLLHICNLLEMPVEIKRWDNMNEEIPWNWPHLIYMNGGELKCTPEIISALNRQRKGLEDFLARDGWFVTVGSTGAILSKQVIKQDGSSYEGLGLLDMTWKERSSVYGDDIWFRTPEGFDVIGNQIQIADVELGEGQEPLGKLVYGRGNNGEVIKDKEAADDPELLPKAGEVDAAYGEGARSGNVIFTHCLGPMPTKNPEYMASILVGAAEAAGIRHAGSITDENIEVEKKSAEYIKKFMLEKM